MTLDPQLAESLEGDLPRAAGWLNQATSNQAVRALIAVILTVVLAYEAVTGGGIPEALLAISSAMIGYYFGVDVPTQPSK